MNVLEFIPSYQTPTKPGEYLVITEKMEYVHLTALFIREEFIAFTNTKNRRMPAADILCYTPIKAARTTVQDTYSAHRQSKPAQLSVVRD